MKVLSDVSVEHIKSHIDLRSIIEMPGGGTRSGNYMHGLCPWHENDGKNHKTKSFLVYADHYNCLSSNCGQHGDVFNWFAWKMYGDPVAPLKTGAFRQIKDFLIDQYLGGSVPITSAPKEERKKIKLTKVERSQLLRLAYAYHRNLLTRPKQLAYFYSRGFTLSTIRKELWGWDGKNYVITVWRGIPQKSSLVTLRLRSSDPDDPQRYSGIRDINDQVLYNRQALLYATKHHTDYMLVFYGEFDARLAWQDGLIAVSPTNGALSFLSEWLDGFDGEVIFVPDKKEEKAGYSDAEQFGTRGHLAHFPKGSFKDYSEFRNSGHKVSELVRRIYQDTRVMVHTRKEMES